MMALQWQTHISALWAAGLLGVLAVWLVVLFRRLRRRHTARQAALLWIPKVVIVLLLVLAYFDPLTGRLRRASHQARLLILQDTSGSMEVADRPDGSRRRRSDHLRKTLEDGLDAYLDLEHYEFDRRLYGASEPTPPRQEIGPDDTPRPTDLGRCLLSLAEMPQGSDCLGAVLLTDGGDEYLRNFCVPSLPVYIVGVGSPPETWNDLAIADLDAPSTVEELAEFTVTIDAAAHTAASAAAEFSRRVGSCRLELAEQTPSGWQPRDERTVDLSAGRARCEFQLTAPAEPGVRMYRVRLTGLPGELSALNNERRFSVEVQKKTIHILFYAQELGWPFGHIRRELGRDTAVRVTALYRLDAERLIVEGSRQAGDEILDRGFPARADLLGKYQVIIIGSFEISYWQPDQMQALLEYVRGGGGVIFLGGQSSFAGGGYAGTLLEPLFPWHLDAATAALQRGRFPVSLSLSAAEHGVMREPLRLLGQADSPFLESVNLPGGLRPAATGLLVVTVGDQNVPVVALQNYGQGRSLGIATNTLWKWTRRSPSEREAFGAFWRAAARCLAGTDEGGRYLSVQWDQAYYRTGEQARAAIRFAGRQGPDQIHLRATVRCGDQQHSVPVQPVGGQRHAYRAEFLLAEPAEHRFELQVLVGTQLLESYSKTFSGALRYNEGAHLEVDHAFLTELAGRCGGAYVPEAEFDRLVDHLQGRLWEQAVTTDVPLVQDRYVYIAVFLLVLVGEWILRRRMNLV